MPKPIIVILALIFSLSIVEANAQKYKDIFPLLDAKDYETAIPQLETFLANPKYADHANANFQMALYFESKVKGYHLINDSTVIIEAAETALTFLTKAKTLITEKELKKNDEYYQAYYRRDLRTGDFGIKISDVQLDVDKKIESTRSIINSGSEIYTNLYAINEANKFCRDTYLSFVKDYVEINEFYLRATQQQLDLLDEMIDKRDIIENAFKTVRKGVSKIQSKGYSPELNFNEISEFGTDGIEEVNLYGNDVEAWDYGSWADEAFTEIDRKVKVMQEQLVTLNKKLIEEGESMGGLTTILYEDLTHAIDPSLIERVKAYDRDPLPLKLLMILIKKNEYDFMTKPLQNPRIEDLDDVDYQLLIADSLVRVLTEIEEDIKVLIEPDVTDAKARYTALVDGEYGGDFGLIKFRKKMESLLGSAKEKWNVRRDEIWLKSLWAINASQTDSIYLLTELDSMYEAPMFDGYYTIATMKDDSSNIYVIGLEFTGSGDKGFLACVSNSRDVLWKENFELTGFSYGDGEKLVMGKFTPSQVGRTTAYIYSLVDGVNKNLIVVSADNEVGQIKWVNSISAPKRPVEVKFNDIVKETIFYYVTEEELETYEGEESPYFVIDRSGKVR
ncbi:MAG: hypothetical protein OCD76_01915 [Reichenbachiella sp.]